MFHPTLAALEKIDSPSDFERLATDLLLPIYPTPVPIGGTGDRGRDATALLYEAMDGGGKKVVFQYSIQATWEAKLKSELAKVKKNGLNPDRYIFVTNQPVSGAARNKFEKLVQDQYGWEFEVYDQEWLRTRLDSPENQRLKQAYLGLAPDTIPLFLSPEDYVSRTKALAFAEPGIRLIGRENELQALVDWLQGDVPVMVLTGQGGVGKTRLLLAFAEHVASEGHWRPVFVRVDAERFEPHLIELAPGQPYVVIVDDAERWAHKIQLVELLANERFKPTKILVATRPNSKDEVLSFARKLPIEVTELPGMSRSDLAQLISSAPLFINDIDSQNAVLDLAQGHPLVAIAASREMLKHRSLLGLTQDEVLGRYFTELVESAMAAEPETTRALLAVIVGLDGIELSTPGQLTSLKALLAIDAGELRRIIDSLVQAGLARESDYRVRIVPPLLADSLLLAWFFPSSGRPRYDFRLLVFEPFISTRKREIVRTLARVKALGKSSVANRLLSLVLDSLIERVQTGDNLERQSALYLVAETAQVCPDEAVLMVQHVVEGPNLDAAVDEHPMFGTLPIAHKDVLTEAIRVLDQTKYSAPEESLRLLRTIATYENGSDEYRQIREEARRTLASFFELDLRRPKTTYDRGLDEVERWLSHDPSDLPLLAWIATLLSPEVSRVAQSPEHERAIAWMTGPVPLSEEVVALRQRVLRMIRNHYMRTASPAVRLAIVEALRTLAPNVRRNLDRRLQARIDEDLEATASFFVELLDAGASLTEQAAIWNWAERMQRFGGYRGNTLLDLMQRIERSAEFQRYVHLVDYPVRYLARDSDWQKTHRAILKFCGKLVLNVDEASIDSLVDDLEAIISEYRNSNRTNTFYVERVLRLLARCRPNLAMRAMRRIATERLTLRHDVGGALQELRTQAPEDAHAFATEWVEAEDPLLHRAVLRSFFGSAERNDEDFGLVERLSHSSDLDVVRLVIQVLPRFQQSHGDQAIRLLTELARNGDEDRLHAIADVIAEKPYDHEGRGHFLEIALDDLEHIVQNLVRLPTLSEGQGDIASALRRLGHHSPLRLLKFLRTRMEREANTSGDPLSGYDAVPYWFPEAFEGLDTHPEFEDSLREVRAWVREARGRSTAQALESARILKQLAQQRLDGPLHSVVDEWVHGSDVERRTVALILTEFEGNPVAYEIARELVGQGADDVIETYVSCMFLSVSTGPFGSLLPAIEERQRLLEKWKTDSSARVRLFAKRMLARLDQLKEFEP